MIDSVLDVIDIVLDPSVTDTFPPIHEGRYEVDPEATGLRSPVPADIVRATRDAGVRLLRVGVGCWLPSQDPAPETLPEREWFLGSSYADANDPSAYCFTHLDRVLDVCRDLDVSVLLSIDSMPASLARPGPPPVIPDAIRHAAPGYTFPDGVRCAPPSEPELFAAAVSGVMRHVRERGVSVRYLELWNEPDLPFFYSGTFEDYLDTYRSFSRRLAGEGYRVGGPSWSGLFAPEQWRDAFCRAVADEALPLDFYSLHRYNDDPHVVIDECRRMRGTLDDAGLHATELLLDEWGYDLRQADYFGTVGNAAFTACCLMALPGAGVSAQTQVLLVDPGPPGDGRRHGLTRKDGDRNPVFHALEAFERFHRLRLRRLRTTAEDVVLAGVDEDMHRLFVLLANPAREERKVRLRLVGPAADCTRRDLTQSSYDRIGGWDVTGPVTVGQGGAELAMEPESLVLLEGDLG